MGNLFLPVRRTIKQIDSKLSGVNQVCKRIISEDDNEQKRKFESENKIDTTDRDFLSQTVIGLRIEQILEQKHSQVSRPTLKNFEPRPMHVKSSPRCWHALDCF